MRKSTRRVRGLEPQTTTEMQSVQPLLEGKYLDECVNPDGTPADPHVYSQDPGCAGDYLQEQGGGDGRDDGMVPFMVPATMSEPIQEVLEQVTEPPKPCCPAIGVLQKMATPLTLIGGAITLVAQRVMPKHPVLTLAPLALGAGLSYFREEKRSVR